ncbi:hypothetical protein VUR80DRAFT_5141 [Thermomyces stellatus]
MGREEGPVAIDELLGDGKYYFVLDGRPVYGTPYPIVLSFDHWLFLYGEVLESWQLLGTHEPDVNKT